jgi:uncharacterized protein
VKLVLDTNVLVAAFLTRGVCHDLLERCQREHEIVLSSFILSEFESKLVGKFKVPAAEARAAWSLLEQHVTLVEPAPLEERVSRDPDDDVVLGTALAGACECIVSGDRDLRDLKIFRGIRILSPGKFWSYEASRESRT